VINSTMPLLGFAFTNILPIKGKKGGKAIDIKNEFLK